MRCALCAMIVTLLTLGNLAAAESQTISFSSLLDEMVDRDAAGRFPYPAYTCRQASSYDQASVSAEETDTWWANNDRSFFIRSEQNDGREEWVMMDAEGPGCIVRIWITASNACGTIRFYLDGSDTPVIAEEAQKLIGDNALVGPPLSKTRARGRNLYLPIPYAKHCKITYDRPNFQQSKNQDDLLYYQINYRTYEPDAKVESFSQAGIRRCPSNESPSCRSELLKPGRGVAAGSETTRAARRHLAAGPGDADDDHWPGRRSAIGREAGSRRHRSRHAADRLARRIRRQADRLVPGRRLLRKRRRPESVSRLVAGGLRGRPHGLLLADALPPSMSIHVGELWQATGQGDSPGRKRAMDVGRPIDVLPRKLAAGAPKSTPAERSDWNYIQTTGQGVYMGDTLCVVNPVKAWWGEGDEKIYVDGETFPSHFGTGTEDYYGYAWCTPEFFESPFHAQPRAQGPANFGHVTNTRVRLLDGIPFTQVIESGHGSLALASLRDPLRGGDVLVRPGGRHEQPRPGARFAAGLQLRAACRAEASDRSRGPWKARP